MEGCKCRRFSPTEKGLDKVDLQKATWPESTASHENFCQLAPRVVPTRRGCPTSRPSLDRHRVGSGRCGPRRSRSRRVARCGCRPRHRSGATPQRRPPAHLHGGRRARGRSLEHRVWRVQRRRRPKVPVATVGTTLHPTGGEPFKIKKARSVAKCPWA